jgi:hypothetical protein
MVMYVALITLALTLSAATVKEANTFLFKLDFLKPEGLMALLFMANVFCFIRYQNYAVTHEDTLNEIWQLRLLSDTRVQKVNIEHEYFDGVLGDLYTSIHDDQDCKISGIQYKTRYLLLRYLVIHYVHLPSGDGFINSHNILKEINIIQYLKLLWIEVDLRGHFLINNRETLDLLAPKLISIAAFLSILMRDKLHIFTDLFSIVPQ